jgi:hypothetical protein
MFCFRKNKNREKLTSQSSLIVFITPFFMVPLLLRMHTANTARWLLMNFSSLKPINIQKDSTNKMFLW